MRQKYKIKIILQNVMNIYCKCHYTLLSLLYKCATLCGSGVAHLLWEFNPIALQRLPPFRAFFILKIMEIDIRKFWNFSLREIDGKMMLQESNRLMPSSFEQIDEIYKALINTLEYYNDNSFDSESLEIEEERQKEEYSIECKNNFNKKESSQVHLYLILNESENRLKIGRSKNPQKRIKQLQCATGDKLSFLKIIDSMGNKEMEVHRKFSHLRLSAEWFKYSKEIIDFFEDIQ